MFRLSPIGRYYCITESKQVLEDGNIFGVCIDPLGIEQFPWAVILDSSGVTHNQHNMKHDIIAQL